MFSGGFAKQNQTPYEMTAFSAYASANTADRMIALGTALAVSVFVLPTGVLHLISAALLLPVIVSIILTVRSSGRKQNPPLPE